MFRIAHLASDQAGKRFVSSAVGGKLGTVSQPGTNSPQRTLCMGKLTMWDLETMKAEVGHWLDYFTFLKGFFCISIAKSSTIFYILKGDFPLIVLVKSPYSVGYMYYNILTPKCF